MEKVEEKELVFHAQQNRDSLIRILLVFLKGLT